MNNTRLQARLQRLGSVKATLPVQNDVTILLENVKGAIPIMQTTETVRNGMKLHHNGCTFLWWSQTTTQRQFQSEMTNDYHTAVVQVQKHIKLHVAMGHSFRYGKSEEIYKFIVRNWHYRRHKAETTQIYCSILNNEHAMNLHWWMIM